VFITFGWISLTWRSLPRKAPAALLSRVDLADAVRLALTVALLQVARMVSRYDQERAAAVIAEIRQDRKTSMDEETYVDVSSAQAFVAAGRNDQEALHNSLRNGFVSANRILLEQQRIGRSSSLPALTPLVHIGMEKDPNFTITFVEALPASRSKAEVLLDAAAALSGP
jgi:hypothetical protein